MKEGVVEQSRRLMTLSVRKLRLIGYIVMAGVETVILDQDNLT